MAQTSVKRSSLRIGFSPHFYKSSVAIDPEKMWENIEDYDRRNYLMGASIHLSSEGEHRREDGLVECHAYSVIHAVERKGFKLVCCRTDE